MNSELHSSATSFFFKGMGGRIIADCKMGFFLIGNLEIEAVLRGSTIYLQSNIHVVCLLIFLFTWTRSAASLWNVRVLGLGSAPFMSIGPKAAWEGQGGEYFHPPAIKDGNYFHIHFIFDFWSPWLQAQSNQQSTYAVPRLVVSLEI